MKIASVLASIALVSSGSVTAKTFSCTFGNIYALNETEEGISGSPIQFGQQSNPAWKFELTKTEREIEIVWQSSPLQFEGKTPAIQTGPNSFAAFWVGRGPCMFTEGHCGATPHYVQQDDDTLTFHYQPIALIRTGERREPLKVFAQGTCAAPDEEK